MSAYDITAVAVGAAHGLAYLEREKIVHGDFSADSIHLDEKGAAKIGDFGFQDTKKNIEKANASSFWFAKRAVANQNQVTPEPTNPAELSSDPRADAAATSIQAAHRGAVARKTVAVMRDPAAQAAATTIQAAHRGAQARKDVAKMRDGGGGDGGGPVSESFVSSGYGARDADRVHSNGRSRRMHANAREAQDATETLSEGEGERNLFEAAVAGAVRWAGFGLGRVAPAAAASNRAGAVCEGKEAKNEEEEAEKAAWMAPELLKKGKKAKKTPASDVYALGMTLWQLYERRKPYGDATAYEIKVRVLGGERPEFKSSSVPFKIKGIVECCLKEKPKARPAATEVSFMIQEAAKEMKKPATKLVDKGIVKHEKKFT
jgi:serine/threonine protein kinase